MTSKKAPSRDGKFDGEEVNGWVWSDNQWVRDTDKDDFDDALVSHEMPTDKGTFDGEVVNGWRYDARADEWIEHVGVDRTVDVPAEHVHTGDGTPEHPHNVVRSSSWH